MLEVSVRSLDNPVEATVLLGIVYLPECAMENNHAEPLETTEPLVQDECFQVQEPKQIQKLAGGVEVIDDGAVLKDEV